MATKDTDLFFVAVDEYEDHPETGELMLKRPVMREQIPYINEQAYTKDGVYHPAIADSLVPDKWNGLYIVKAGVGAERRKRMLAVMKQAVEDYEGKIIGPFESRELAIQAKHAARPPTPKELNKSLSAKVESQNAELADLKAKLAAYRV